MTGPEHYIRAEQLLREVRDGHQEGTDVAAILSAAQTHAALALTAATAMQAPVDGSEPGMGSGEFEEWYQAAGVKPPKSSNDDYDDEGSIHDAYSESELYEMDRDAEYRQDAEDDARNTAEVEAEERGDA